MINTTISTSSLVISIIKSLFPITIWWSNIVLWESCTKEHQVTPYGIVVCCSILKTHGRCSRIKIGPYLLRCSFWEGLVMGKKEPQEICVLRVHMSCTTENCLKSIILILRQKHTMVINGLRQS